MSLHNNGSEWKWFWWENVGASCNQNFEKERPAPETPAAFSVEQSKTTSCCTSKTPAAFAVEESKTTSHCMEKTCFEERRFGKAEFFTDIGLAQAFWPVTANSQKASDCCVDKAFGPS